MIDKIKGAKWGYINEKQEPEPIPQKYQELIEIREKAVAESMLKIIDAYQKDRITAQRKTINGKQILLVEDGSVDIDKLEKDGFYVIVYRQGSRLPEFLK